MADNKNDLWKKQLAESRRHERLFQHAKYRDNKALTELLAEEAFDIDWTERVSVGKVGVPTYANVTPFMAAVLCNHGNELLSKLELLRQRGANIDHLDTQSGLSAYLLAALNVNVDVLTLLDEWGADGSAKDNYGQTALHLACNEFNGKTLDCLSYIIAKQNPNELDNNGNNALCKLASSVRLDMRENSAMERMYCDAMRMLVGNGGDINRRNAKGDTPLLSYLKADLKKIRFNVIRTFLELGANPNIKNCKGRTALDLFSKQLKQIAQWNILSDDVADMMASASEHCLLTKNIGNMDEPEGLGF